MDQEKILPENAPVRLASAQLEELDYSKLYRAYSPKGRKSAADPRVMFKVMAYGYQCGIFSSRALEEACRYRVDFMWLLEEENPPDHTTFARFRTKRCAEAVEDLFYQYVSYEHLPNGRFFLRLKQGKMIILILEHHMHVRPLLIVEKDCSWLYFVTCNYKSLQSSRVDSLDTPFEIIHCERLA